MRKQSPTLILLPVAILLAGCATPRAGGPGGPYGGYNPREPDQELARAVASSEIKGLPVFDPDELARRLDARRSPVATDRLVVARALIQAGVHQERHRRPWLAAGRYLEAAGEAEAVLRHHPRGSVHDAALTIYSTASRSFLRLWAAPNANGLRERWEVQGLRGPRVVTRSALPSLEWPKGRITQLVPADTVKRRRLKPRVTIEGLGLPMVAGIIRQPGELAPRRNDVPATSLLDPADAPGEPDRVALLDPKRAETIPLAGSKYPVAADFTTPLDRELLIHRGIRFMEIMGVLNPAKFMQKEGIYVLDPFDPDRIPVVFIHGLQSSSFAWLPMINGLTADPAIRRRYQFWVYQYPTGLPISLASAHVRDHLDKVNELYRSAGRSDNGNRMVLVGHSMGGLHSRMQIIDSGNEFYSTFAQIPLEDLPITESTRASLRKSLLFEHRPYVARVVFIATPHKGSEIAGGWIGKLTVVLIRAPGDVLGMTRELLTLRNSIPGILIRRPPTSIAGLSPTSGFVRALNSRPLPKDVPYHSIIGDRGRGDTPRSSDGVVPYWSSHVEGAASEKIVPSDHGALRNPEGIAETRRILLEHLSATAPRAKGGRRPALRR